ARITLGVTQLTVREDGAIEDAEEPPENPGAAISLGTADARYVQVGGTLDAGQWSNPQQILRVLGRGRLPLSVLPKLDLAENAAQAIDSRIAGATPSSAMPIFTTQDHGAGTYIRNPDCWAADLRGLSALSPWNAHYG